MMTIPQRYALDTACAWAAASALLTGCASLDAPQRASTAPRPAAISHVVFARLADPAAAEELLADSERMLAGIPGVVAFAAGPHLDTGRPTVIDDYHIGLYIGFDSTAAYTAYLDHPDHVAFVASWGPRLEWLRIYDISDPTP